MAAEGGDDIADSLSQLEISGAAAFSSVDADSDDEEEEGDEPPVVIGFVQKPSRPWSLSRQHFPSKAGGTPAWLDPIHLPTGLDICCGICKAPLQFLMQVYAPIDGKQEAFHRTLFVFMCPSMACLKEDQRNQVSGSGEHSFCSMKVFRCQLSRDNEYYSKDPPKHDGSDVSTVKGAPLCSWCGSWKGEKVCGGCKKLRYCSRNHQLEHWRSNHAAVCKAQTNPNGNQERILMEDGSARPACNKLWQEFEIVDEEEGPPEDETTQANLPILHNVKEDEISRQFLEVEPTEEQKHWAHFQERLSRAPEQILRYCRSRDAKPLWPKLEGKPDESSIPVCAVCKGPRIFEFQILPQLLYYFKTSNEPDSLDWATIAVYSCESSCTAAKAYVEEFAWVQLP